MHRRYNISNENIIKSFVYSHHKSCGWEYCVLVHNAWKFFVTIRDAGGCGAENTLDDYLIVEYPTMDSAIQFCNSLPENLPRVSIWERGRIVYDNKDDKEKQNG